MDHLHGHFEDGERAVVITDPRPPRPWINYLGNRRLSAFISQNAGGAAWYRDPRIGRLTRYHYLAPPGDRPGFYLYARDRETGDLWNPHFAPTCAPLDRFECRHRPGSTSFLAERHGVRIRQTCAIAPDADVMVWLVEVENLGAERRCLQLASYLEFGLLEFEREAYWCYLAGHAGFDYDPHLQAIRYDYHVFDAPLAPRILFGCSETPAGFDCSREAFIGRMGSLAAPAALTAGRGLTNSELPDGGHGCGSLEIACDLAGGEAKALVFTLAIADDWETADRLLVDCRSVAAARKALAAAEAFWDDRLDVLQARTGDETVDRFINTWQPYNAAVALEFARRISADHVGLNGLQYRDTAQDALAGASIDPAFAAERMEQVFANQGQDGSGCYAFWPGTNRPVQMEPKRSDNTVWQVMTVTALLAETGDLSWLEREIAFRDGGSASVYEHLRRGLHYIWDRRGLHGLPLLAHADWNDGLAVFGDERAESVMLGMQLVYAARLLADLARWLGREEDVAWCERAIDELTDALNSDAVWDGRWYRRLLLSDGRALGSANRAEGRIYLTPQAWAVIGCVADDDRGRQAMDAVAEHLDTPIGLRILAPSYTGIPEPTDSLRGSSPGQNENGAIFCHANTWAIIAEAMLGRPDRAMKYYRQMLPERVADHVGADLYAREPYAHVSTIFGPDSKRYGEAGNSWLTGTASWAYVAATQYLLGIQPTLDGLRIRPCLPADLGEVRVHRRFRGGSYEFTMKPRAGESRRIELDGERIEGDLLPIVGATSVQVMVEY